MVEESLPKNQLRTAIVYFGPKREDYLRLAAAEDSREFLSFIPQPLPAQLEARNTKQVVLTPVVTLGDVFPGTKRTPS